VRGPYHGFKDLTARTEVYKEHLATLAHSRLVRRYLHRRYEGRETTYEIWTCHGLERSWTFNSYDRLGKAAIASSRALARELVALRENT
jgi:hypothetical protein